MKNEIKNPQNLHQLQQIIELEDNLIILDNINPEDV